MIRRLRFFTKRGHTDAITCICTGSTLCDGLFLSSADQIVVTASKDGSAVVWELDAKLNCFRLKCSLHPPAASRQRVKSVKMNADIKDVACCLMHPGLPILSEAPYQDAFVVTATGAGSQVWHFQGGRTAAKCVDALNDMGIPERWLPNGTCSHKCVDCGNPSEILCLALAPPRSTVLAEDKSYCFSFFAGATEGRVRLWDVLWQSRDKFELRIEEATMPEEVVRGSQDDPYMQVDGDQNAYKSGLKYRLRHSRDSQVICLGVHSAKGQIVILTGDDLGFVKLWLYGPSPILLRTFSHGQDSSVICAVLTPQLHWCSEQYLITCASGLRHACYIWPVSDCKGDAWTKPVHLAEDAHLVKHLFAATSLCTYERGAGKSIAECSLTVVSGSADGTAKMWDVATSQGLKVPMHQEQLPVGSDPKDVTRIVNKFEHTQNVNDVQMCRVSVIPYHRRSKRGRVSFSDVLPSTSDTTCANDTTKTKLEDQVRRFPVLLTASSDRECMMWNPKNGQPLRSFRAARLDEMFLPPFMIVVTFFQLIGFAFSKDFKWNGAAKAPVTSVNFVVTLDFSNVKEAIDKEYATIHCTSIFFVVFCAGLFDILTLGNVVHKIAQNMRSIESRPAFRAEVAEQRTGLGRLPRGPEHRSYWRLWTIRNILGWIVYVLSTLALVTICSTAISVFDCDTRSPEEASKTNKPEYFLSWWHETACYEDSFHIALVIIVIVTVVPYLWLVQPYSVVQGNAFVISRKDLFRISKWKRNCKQQAGLVYLGPMHTDDNCVFITTVCDNMTKVCFPCIHLLLTNSPQTQVILLLLLAFASLLCFSVYQPYMVSKSMNLFLIMFKAATVLAFACALVSELIDDEQKMLPTVVWYGGVSLIFLLSVPVIYRIAWAEEVREEKRLLAMCKDVPTSALSLESASMTGMAPKKAL